MYDLLIVGAGLFGSSFANICINSNKRVLIIDKREHIGGNCFTKKENNIDVHMYGPHVFHTNNKKIWDYVNKFSLFNNFINRPKVSYDNKIYSFPINLMTLYQLWGISDPIKAKEKLEKVRLKIESPKNLEEWALSQIGYDLYQTFIYGYTKKQWNCEPKDLPSSIIKRIPIRLNFNDNYFNDDYQGIPAEGYTNMILNMVEGADIVLGVDYFKDREYWDSKAKNIIFTGKIDEFYNYSYGRLDYRGLRFETTNMDIDDHQGNAVINYTDYKIPYTRIIEHKHFNLKEGQNNTIITKEYPDEYDDSKIPYYPMNNIKNNELYNKYHNINTSQNKIIFGGRLAEYKYFDMHQIIGSSLSKAEKFLN